MSFLTRDPMPAPPSILAFDSVTTVVDLWPAGDLVGFDLSLCPGELVLIRFDRRDGVGPVPDVAMGLVEPDAGAVRFLGHDWAAQRPAAAGRLRGQIGRLFGHRGWVHHLDVDENVTLRQRHHTRRPLAEIADEADRLARTFGLANGLPTDRPGRVDPRDLQRAACVRMLLGSPPLLVVDEPAAGLPPPLSAAMAGQIAAARSRGAAVVWLTADPRVWQDQSLRPTLQIDRAGAEDDAMNTGARQPWQSPSSSAT